MALDLTAASAQYAQNSHSIWGSGYPWTFSAWVKLDDLSSDYGVVSIGDSAMANRYTGLIFRQAGGVFSLWQNHGTFRRVDSVVTVVAGKWHHVFGVVTANNDRSISVDGETLVNSTLSSGGGAVSSYDRAVIGALGESSEYGKMNGAIDDVGIWNKALGQKKANQLAQGVAPTLVDGDVIDHYELDSASRISATSQRRLTLINSPVAARGRGTIKPSGPVMLFAPSAAPAPGGAGLPHKIFRGDVFHGRVIAA